MSPVALVTGASSGIGAATARRLAAAGYTVYGAGRRAERLAELEEAGVLPLVFDLMDDASMVAAVERVRVEQGRIDVLVNNAGYGSYGAIEDVPLDEARRQFEVNVFALARLTQLIVPSMRQQGSGRIVNITSIGGRIAMALGGWYHATKFAVEGFSDSLRQEVAEFGIEVVVIEPGAIKTEWGGIAARSAIEMSGEGPYASRVRRLAAAFTSPSAVGRASDPDVVAKAIERAVTARRPRTRYRVGSMATPIIAMRRLLRDRAFDALLRRAMG